MVRYKLIRYSYAGYKIWLGTNLLECSFKIQYDKYFLDYSLSEKDIFVKKKHAKNPARNRDEIDFFSLLV